MAQNNTKNLFNYSNMTEEQLRKLLNGKKFIISISGMDNVGKSTQSNMMNSIYGDIFSKPLHINQTSVFPPVGEDGKKISGKKLSEWWFDKNNAQNFVDTIYSALAERYKMAFEHESPIVILDKGIDFYDTRVKATLLTMGFSEIKIAEMMLNAKQKYNLFNSREDLKIIITAKDRNHIKEDEESADNERYMRYMGYNISILNKVLNEDKVNVFKPVEFINNGAELMHEEIIKAIADTVLTKTQYKVHDDLKKTAENIFGDNLTAVILAGSAGKGRYEEGWSDLDVYFILKKYDSEKVREFHNKFSQKQRYHVGTTFFTEKDVTSGRLNNRTKVMLQEISNGKNTILHLDSEFELPKYELKDFIGKEVSEYADSVQNLRKCLTIGTDANRTSLGNNGDVTSKIIKNIALVQKIVLRNSNLKKMSGGYYEISTAFLELLDDMMKKGYKIDDESYKYLKSVDLLQCVKEYNNPVVKDIMVKYAELLLNTLDLVDEYNKNEHEKEIQNEQQK